jgi:hypothetical protein
VKQAQSFLPFLALCMGFVLGLSYCHITKPLEAVPGQHKLDAELAKIKALQDREAAKIKALSGNEGWKP